MKPIKTYVLLHVDGAVPVALNSITGTLDPKQEDHDFEEQIAQATELQKYLSERIREMLKQEVNEYITDHQFHHRHKQ